MISLLMHAVVLSAALFPVGRICADDVAVERYDLPCGIRVVVMCVPGAERQAMYTFLPLTMAQDDAHRAQWAHLVEHMLIRTTDPLRLSFDGMQFNGETMHASLRLETFGDPKKWIDAMERHFHWLVARQLDPAALEREKANIAGEEQGTSLTGMTGKFAIAAWNQVVRHGLAHAAVHGDVAHADFHQVQDYVAARVPADESVLIATIGPTPVEDVKKEIDRLYGKLDVVHVAPAADASDPARFAGSFEATWDLPTRHAMWWWPLPDREPVTLAAATALSQAIMMHAFGSPELKAKTKAVVVQPFVPTPEGLFLLVDASLLPEANADEVWTVLKAMLDGFAVGGPRRQSVPYAGKLAAQNLPPKPDFRLMKAQLKPPMRPNAEGFWLLGQMNLEYSWGESGGGGAGGGPGGGLTFESAFDALMKLDDAAVAPLIERVLTTKPGSLTLVPGAPHDRGIAQDGDIASPQAATTAPNPN